MGHDAKANNQSAKAAFFASVFRARLGVANVKQATKEKSERLVRETTATAAADQAVIAKPDEQELAAQLSALLTAQLLQAEKLLSASGKARHEGVHEGRKCMRRARAILALGGSHLGPLAERLDEKIARVCRSLSSIRDAQALIEALRRLPKAGSDSIAMLASAKESAVRDRDLRMERALERDPEFGKRRMRLLGVLEESKKLDWSGVSLARLHKAIARSEKRLEKSARVAKKRPEDDLTWHRMRRRLRRLRQQLNILEKLLPCESFAAGKAKDIEVQAAQLGESQDDSLLLARCGKGSPFAPQQRTWLRAVAQGRLVQARKSHSD